MRSFQAFLVVYDLDPCMECWLDIFAGCPSIGIYVCVLCPMIRLGYICLGGSSPSENAIVSHYVRSTSATVMSYIPPHEGKASLQVNWNFDALKSCLVYIFCSSNGSLFWHWEFFQLAPSYSNLIFHISSYRISHISLDPGCFYWRTVLEIKLWVLVTLLAFGMSWLLGPLSW